METQIKSYFQTSNGPKLVNLFGYSTKGVPSLEIYGAGKHSKKIKEKIIYLTRKRKLKIPLKRFVICVDENEKGKSEDSTEQLEFPLLLAYWYLCGFIPIKKLDDCICSGEVSANGVIKCLPLPDVVFHQAKKTLDPVEIKSLKYIGKGSFTNTYTRLIDAGLLLEHIPSMKITNYMERASAIPLKSFIA